MTPTVELSTVILTNTTTVTGENVVNTVTISGEVVTTTITITDEDQDKTYSMKLVGSAIWLSLITSTLIIHSILNRKKHLIF